MKLIFNQKGFSAIEGLLIVIILAIVGGTGYYVYHSRQATDRTLNSAQNETSAVKISKTTVTTFDECQKSAGSIIQTSYPEVCVTKSGQRFIQSTTPASGIFKIPELGIEFNLPSSLEDLNYAVSEGPDGVDVSTRALSAADSDCKATNQTGALGGISKRTGIMSDASAPDDPIKQFNGFYIVYDEPQMLCSQNQQTDDKITADINDLEQALATVQLAQ